MKRSPLRRKTHLAARNDERRARLFAIQFGSKYRVDFYQALPCDICGAIPSECSHVPSRGAGGRADDMIPHCTQCHRNLHKGVETFTAFYEINLIERAAAYAALWWSSTAVYVQPGGDGEPLEVRRTLKEAAESWQEWHPDTIYPSPDAALDDYLVVHWAVIEPAPREPGE